ncbi:hypothetical protein Trydic_g5777 [Trypoxylus dichotomus]
METQTNSQQVYNSHLICHVHFRDGNRASNNVLKKNAMPLLFLHVPTVENILDHEYWRSIADTTAVTLDSDGINRKLRDHQYCRSLAGSSVAALNSDGVR